MLHYGNICQCIFLYFLTALFIQYFGSSWRNDFHEVLIINRIIGKAGGKHIISTMQGNSTITYIQHSKMCVQKNTTQYNGKRDW